jgi:hypothetical protein
MTIAVNNIMESMHMKRSYLWLQHYTMMSLTVR